MVGAHEESPDRHDRGSGEGGWGDGRAREKVSPSLEVVVQQVVTASGVVHLHGLAARTSRSVSGDLVALVTAPLRRWLHDTARMLGPD